MGRIFRDKTQIFYHRDKSKAKKNTRYGGRLLGFLQYMDRDGRVIRLEEEGRSANLVRRGRGTIGRFDRDQFFWKEKLDIFLDHGQLLNFFGGP
jgi:hypothetical protein